MGNRCRAWRMRLSALRATRATAGGAARALGEAFARPGACSLWRRLAILFVAVFAAPLGRRARRADRNAAKFDRPELTQPLGGFGDELRLAARPLGRRLVPARSPTRVTERDAPRTPSSRSTRCSPAACRRAGRRLPRRVLIAAYAVSLAALLRGPRAALPADGARARAGAPPADAAAPLRLPGVAVLRRALLGEPVPAPRSAPSTRRGPELDVGRRGGGPPPPRAAPGILLGLRSCSSTSGSTDRRGADAGPVARWLAFAPDGAAARRSTAPMAISGSPTATRWPSRAPRNSGAVIRGAAGGAWEGLVAA